MSLPNCRKCIFFYVTWDKNNPNGCKYFGFKTKLIPSAYVLRSSGEPCKAFKSKDNEPNSGNSKFERYV